jgi:adenylosuccinate lyase
VIAPDATIALDFALARLARVVADLEVRAETMAANLARTGGAIFSEHVLLALVRKGVARDEAYRWIQRHALVGGDLQARLRDDADVRRHLGTDEIASLFDITHSLRHIDALFARALEDGDGAA